MYSPWQSQVQAQAPWPWMGELTSGLAMQQLIKSHAYNQMAATAAQWPAIPSMRLPDANIVSESKVPFDYYAVLDFECTCERNSRTFQNEIIEFPVVFLNARTLQVEMEFRKYVRPTEKPILSAFCKELTGIEQDFVDKADTLDVVLLEFDRFLRDKGLVATTGDGVVANRMRSFVITTDGPTDVLSFLRKECQRKGLPLQTCWDNFVDVRHWFAAWFNVRRCGIGKMLEQCGLEFQGREHSGIDDARNLARVAAEMIRAGCPLVSESWKNRAYLM